MVVVVAVVVVMVMVVDEVYCIWGGRAAEVAVKVVVVIEVMSAITGVVYLSEKDVRVVVAVGSAGDHNSGDGQGCVVHWENKYSWGMIVELVMEVPVMKGQVMWSVAITKVAAVGTVKLVVETVVCCVKGAPVMGVVVAESVSV